MQSRAETHLQELATAALLAEVATEALVIPAMKYTTNPTVLLSRATDLTQRFSRFGTAATVFVSGSVAENIWNNNTGDYDFQDAGVVTTSTAISTFAAVPSSSVFTSPITNLAIRGIPAATLLTSSFTAGLMLGTALSNSLNREGSVSAGVIDDIEARVLGFDTLEKELETASEDLRDVYAKLDGVSLATEDGQKLMKDAARLRRNVEIITANIELNKHASDTELEELESVAKIPTETLLAEELQKRSSPITVKIEHDTPYNKYVDSKIVDVCLSDLDHPTVSNALKDILCQPEINPASELFRVHQHLKNSQQSCIDVNDLNTPDMSLEVLDLLEFKKSLQSLDVVGVGKQRSGGMCS